MNFPVSIKGVLVEAGRVVLLENDRDEWELPGGRLEPGEDPETCLAREFAEELGAVVVVAGIIDCWVYEVLPGREVVIVTYGVERRDQEELRVSDEHRPPQHPIPREFASEAGLRGFAGFEATARWFPFVTVVFEQHR